LNKLTIDLGQANELYLALQGNMNNLANLTQSISQIVVRTNAQQITPTTVGTIFAFLLSTMFVGLIGYLIYRTITAPLSQLTDLTRCIGKGEMHARASLRGNNEITTVGNSLDTMVSLMQNVEHQRDDLQARIEALMNEVKGVGNGDLSIQANVTNDTFGILANSFNYMLRELSGLVIRDEYDGGGLRLKFGGCWNFS
jgi:methyl-accepting chemotaxis protein